MNSGRHFSPPTPAFRPQDPFSELVPRSAERVPSCDAVTPPPFRPRPVRMDPADPKEAAASKTRGLSKYAEPQGLSAVVSRPIKRGFSQRRGKRTEPRPIVSAPLVLERTDVLKSKPSMSSEKPARSKIPLKESAIKPVKEEQVKKCEWIRCEKTFVVNARGHAVVRRFCSATCRGRASEARTGKRVD